MKCKRPLGALALHAMPFQANVVASPFGDAMPHSLLPQPRWSPKEAADVRRQHLIRSAAKHCDFGRRVHTGFLPVQNPP